MDFFQIAIDTEQMVEDHYRDLADHCTTNKGIKNILTMLADDHRKHKVAFEKMKKEEKVPHLTNTLAIKKAIEVFNEIKEKKNSFTCDMDEVKLYTKARELVKHKIRLYTDAKYGLKDVSQKKIIKSIIAEEKKQAEVLENIIEMVNRPNTWLENAEFYHLDEY